MDFIRLMLVLACMAPLFILMAIRGVGVVPWEIYFPAFIGLALSPNLILVFRILLAIKNDDRKRIRATNSTDNREQLITYVFAMLLPLFQSAVSTEQDLYAALCALLFVVYIFGHMELYYMNFFFSLAGYRILSVRPDPSSGSLSVAHVLITKRSSMPGNLDINPIRITDFLLFDK
jgi:hypothetical protein